MRNEIICTAVVFAACSKPTHLLGNLPPNAGELFGALCADVGSGKLEPDDQLARATATFTRSKLTPELEGIRCGPQRYRQENFNSLVYDAKTRRLFAMHVVARYKDISVLEQLLLPALSDSERLGYQLEKMRIHAPWVGEMPHFWSDGHTLLWMSRSFDLDEDKRGNPKPDDRFQVEIFVEEK